MNQNYSTPENNPKSVSVDWSLILNNLPTAWVLTPVLNKRPLRPNWQSEDAIARSELITLMASGQMLTNDRGKKWRCQWTGVGLRLGEISGGSLAIDCDGERAIARLLEMAGGELPHTVSWTSGKPGRQQLLISIPQEHWGAISNKKIDCGNGEYLEFRWNGCQSVLPPSKHPETGAYHWINSPLDTSVAAEPDWMNDFFLSNNLEEEIKTLHPCHTNNKPSQPTWDDIDWAKSYLAAIHPTRADNYEDWVKVGMALHSISDQLLTDWEQWSASSGKYKSGECEKKWRSFSRSGIKIGSLAHWAKQDGWESPFKKKVMSNSTSNTYGNKSTSRTKQQSLDTQKPDFLSIPETVNRVKAILLKGLEDHSEQAELDWLQPLSEMSKASFWKSVSNIKSELDEVQPGDLLKVDQIINNLRFDLDWLRLVPKPLGQAFIKDGQTLNIDPVCLWQYLLPTCLSLVGKKVNLDMISHLIPPVVFSTVIGESGNGKSRAEGVILSPLKELQHQESARFKQEFADYEKVLENKKKGESEPEPPTTERLFYCETATIQSVMKFIAEQHNNGTVWARDEILGLFKSIGQFSSKDSEGLECVLKFWDGSGIKVDRVNKKDCFMTLSTCLNIVGGIQPGVFNKLYKDKDDSQGLGARFLHAVPKPVEHEFTFGYCLLSDILPNLYRQLDNIPKGNVKLSQDSMKLYKVLYKKFMKEASKETNPAIRAWKKKACSHIVRIALGLHLIEWCFDNSRNLWELQTDTLEKAMEFTIYYQNNLQLIHAKTSSDDDTSSTLFKIWDLAVANPEGITPRDAYRAIRALTNQAKNCGRAVVDYTRTLFLKLVEDGKGKLAQNGRNIKFIANFINPEGNGNQTSPAPTPPSPPNNSVIPTFSQGSNNQNLGGKINPPDSTNTLSYSLLKEDVAVLTPPESQVNQENEVSTDLCQASGTPPQLDKVVSVFFEQPSGADAPVDVVFTQQPHHQSLDELPLVNSKLKSENKEIIEKPIPSGRGFGKKETTKKIDEPLPEFRVSNPPLKDHPNQTPSPGDMSTRVEIVTSSCSFYLEGGDRLRLVVDNKYFNSYQFKFPLEDGSLLFENETISKVEKLTQKDVESRLIEFLSTSTGSLTPRPLPEMEDVENLTAMFTESLKGGLEDVEDIFSVLTDSWHLNKRVWKSLGNVVEQIKQIAPDVYERWVNTLKPA